MIIVFAKAAKNELADEIETLKEIKNKLKDDPIIIALFKEYGRDISLFDGIPIDISDDIDVSAKTINSRIILNKRLLEEPFEILCRYAVHELVHSLQHLDIDTNEDPYADLDYLDRPDELKAFQEQIKYDEENRSKEDVIDYVEDLLDYHDIDEDDREDKKDELLELI